MYDTTGRPIRMAAVSTKAMAVRPSSVSSRLVRRIVAAPMRNIKAAATLITVPRQKMLGSTSPNHNPLATATA